MALIGSYWEYPPLLVLRAPSWQQRRYEYIGAAPQLVGGSWNVLRATKNGQPALLRLSILFVIHGWVWR